MKLIIIKTLFFALFIIFLVSAIVSFNTNEKINISKNIDCSSCSKAGSCPDSKTNNNCK